jgi:hypothetical protein
MIIPVTVAFIPRQINHVERGTDNIVSRVWLEDGAGNVIYTRAETIWILYVYIVYYVVNA